jgi:prohibitin 1
MSIDIDRLLGKMGLGDEESEGRRPSPSRSGGSSGSSGGNGGGGLKLVGAIIVALVLAGIFFGWCLVIVPAGHVGVKDTFGIVAADVFQPGLHIKSPFTAVRDFSIQTQKYYDYGTSGANDVATITALSNEGLPVTIGIALNYHLEPQAVPELYKTVGEEYPVVIMLPSVHAVPRDIISKYDVKTLYSARSETSADRAKIEEELFNGIKRNLLMNGVSRGIVLEAVFIRNIELPAELTDAIKNKLKMEQQIAQKSFEVSVAEKEADRKVAEAEGIAKANRIIADSITPAYLKFYWIESMKENPKAIYVPVGQDGIPIFKTID